MNGLNGASSSNNLPIATQRTLAAIAAIRNKNRPPETIDDLRERNERLKQVILRVRGQEILDSALSDLPFLMSPYLPDIMTNLVKEYALLTKLFHQIYEKPNAGDLIGLNERLNPARTEYSVLMALVIKDLAEEPIRLLASQVAMRETQVAAREREVIVMQKDLLESTEQLRKQQEAFEARERKATPSRQKTPESGKGFCGF